jgi:hypothetical protein
MWKSFVLEQRDEWFELVGECICYHQLKFTVELWCVPIESFLRCTGWILFQVEERAKCFIPSP